MSRANPVPPWADQRLFPLAVMLIFLGLGGGVQAEEVATAAWYPDPAVVFNDQEYLAFLGEGKDAKAAAEDAMDKLARYFGVDINSVSTGSETYVESGTGTEGQSRLERSISTHVSTVSKHSLYSVMLTPALRLRDDRWAMVAHMQRTTARVAWDQVEQAALDQLTTRLDTMANESVGMGLRLVAQKAAAVLLTRIADCETKRKLITPSTPALVDSGLPARYARLRDGLLPRLAIRIQSTGDSAPDFASLAAEQLSGAGFLMGDQGDLTLKVTASLRPGPAVYGLKSIQWRLDLVLADQKNQVFSLTLQGKAGGSTDEAATDKAMRDAGAAVEKQFIPALIDRLGSALD